MTSPIKKNIPTPLEREYKEQLKQAALNNSPANKVKNLRAGLSATLGQDVVTLSSSQSDDTSSPVKKTPSQPLTFDEKQALQTQFSIYG